MNGVRSIVADWASGNSPASPKAFPIAAQQASPKQAAAKSPLLPSRPSPDAVLIRRRLLSSEEHAYGLGRGRPIARAKRHLRRSVAANRARRVRRGCSGGAFYRRGGNAARPSRAYPPSLGSGRARARLLLGRSRRVVVVVVASGTVPAAAGGPVDDAWVGRLGARGATSRPSRRRAQVASSRSGVERVPIAVSAAPGAAPLADHRPRFAVLDRRHVAGAPSSRRHAYTALPSGRFAAHAVSAIPSSTGRARGHLRDALLQLGEFGRILVQVDPLV